MTGRGAGGAGGRRIAGRRQQQEGALEVLPRFLHCSRREAQAVSAELAPLEAPPHRTVITALPAAAAHPAEVQPSIRHPTAPAAPAAQVSACAPSTRVQSVELSAPTPAPRSDAQPLTADLRRLHVTVSKRFMEKLEAARDALSHSHLFHNDLAARRVYGDELMNRFSRCRSAGDPRPAPPR
jgi:hypothetical protein